LGLNVFKSPVGEVAVESLYGEIISIRFKSIPESQLFPDDATEMCISQLKEYFHGEREKFTVPIKLAVTEFQESVLNEVNKTPYGKIRSYQDVAVSLGNKDFVRAVGMANSKNPIPIIVPCHRVIGENGSLVGYVGGLSAKKWLLEHEQKATQLSLF